MDANRPMLRAVIVDDEPLARRRVRTLLRAEPDIELIAECRNGREAISVVRQERPDLVFLDIQMPEIDGFGVLEALQGQELPVVIFITAYDQHAIRAFEVHALDYLLKPFDSKRFRNTLDYARRVINTDENTQTRIRIQALVDELRSLRHNDENIIVRDGDTVSSVPLVEIDWIESSGNYVTLHARRTKHLLRETMKSLEARLDRRLFRRIHRRTMVNIKRVKELRTSAHGDYTLVLRDDTTLVVSRRFRRNLDGAL